MIHLGLTLLIVTGAAAQAPGGAHDSSAELAERLAGLRAEVEGLSEELELAEAERKERRAAALARLTELEAERKREALRKKRLRTEQARLQAAVREASAEDEALLPAVLAGLGELEQSMARGLPFKLADRRAEVEGLRQRVKSGALGPRQGLLRLWSLLQDERKLTGETGLFKQAIELPRPGGQEGREEVLVEVVRLGMVALYFQAPDGRVGLARRTGPEQWRFEVLDDEADQARVRALFDAQKKQIRTGYFELPLASLEPARSPR